MNRNDILGQIKRGIINKLNEVDEENDAISVSLEKISIEELFEELTQENEDGYKLTELFSIIQGTTIGGKGSTKIFSDVEGNVDIAGDLVYKSIMGRNINADQINWTDEYLIFPYFIKNNKFIPAFYNEENNYDTLNFDMNLDQQELGKDRHQKLLYREAKGYLGNTDVAEYLFQHFETLYYRFFEGKSISEYGKSWYEYHRPRQPDILSSPKIVARRLMKEPSFAIDDYGYLPRDSVISLIPTCFFNSLLEELTEIIGEDTTLIQGFKYVLSYLNSDFFFRVLARKRAKKKGDYPILGERMLSSVVIPPPSSLKIAEIRNKLGIDI